jgi:arabinose-5-phosphate isomerase
MKPNPRTISDNALAAQAAQIMEEHRITSLLVVDDQQRLCGFVNTNDLMRAKVI